MQYTAECAQGCRGWKHRRFGDARLTAETRSISHALRWGHCVTVTTIDLTRLTASVYAVFDHSDALPIIASEEAPF